MLQEADLTTGVILPSEGLSLVPGEHLLSVAFSFRSFLLMEISNSGDMLTWKGKKNKIWGLLS